MASSRSSRFDILVCYDVDTTTPTGAKRLRKMSKVCCGYGQRVQYSLFECTLTDSLLERFRSKLLDIIDGDKDSLRIYFLHGARDQRLECYGCDRSVDFEGPLVV